MIDTCPACGSHVLYEVDLAYSGDNGFRPDAYGHTPEIGDSIASCGDCASFVVLDENGQAANAVTEPEHQAADVGAPALTAVPPPAPEPAPAAESPPPTITE